MTPGDLPCNAPCSWRWCRWWQDGHCQDNDTCERAELIEPSMLIIDDPEPWDAYTDNEMEDDR